MTEIHRLGQRLLEIRLHRGMTQRSLARAIGVTIGTIQNYERGRTLVPVDRIDQLAMALQCEPPEMLDPPGSALPKYRFSAGSRVGPMQRDIPNLWPFGLGFYGRNAHETNSVDVDGAVLAACGLPANVPGHMAWIDWMKRIHTDDRAQVQAELEHLQCTGAFAMQYRLLGWDGVERSIVDCSRTTGDRLQGMMLDVTHSRRTSNAEQTIRRIIKAVRKISYNAADLKTWRA